LDSQQQSSAILTKKSQQRTQLLLAREVLTRRQFHLKALKHIAEENNVNIEDLTAQQVIDWFEQDGKIRRAGN